MLERALDVTRFRYALVPRATQPTRGFAQLAAAEDGGDDAEDLRSEFIANGIENVGQTKNETRPDGSRFKAFFVVAPDGLCYWFGEKLSRD